MNSFLKHIVTKLTYNNTKHVRRCYLHTKRKPPIDPDYYKLLPINKYVIAPHKRNRVYVWGNLRTGALGVLQRKADEQQHPIEFYKSPRRMYFAEKHSVQHIAAGFGYTLFATDSHVYGAGLNAESQIGYHTLRANAPLEMICAPMHIHLGAASNDGCKILRLSAGRAHSAVLTDKGLYLFGSNAYGQCARTIIDDEDYRGNRMLSHVEQLDGQRIVDVVCGQDHTMVIVEDGSVYSCGWGADGQTGLEHYNCTGAFTKVLGDLAGERVRKLACRSDFVLAISETDRVFGWGNNEYSQMMAIGGEQQLARPTRIPFFEEQRAKIVDVAAGGSFCAALTADGDVYVWGFGLLGFGPQVAELTTPQVIPKTLLGTNEFNDDVRIVSVQAGLSHMAAVTNHGELYTWGRNRSCCLGLGMDKDQFFPLKVALGGSVKTVSCGLDHMLALCTSYLQVDQK